MAVDNKPNLEASPPKKRTKKPKGRSEGAAGETENDRREKAALQRLTEANDSIPPEMEVSSGNGKRKIIYDNLSQHIESLGIKDPSFFFGLLDQYSRSELNGPNNTDLNFTLSVIRDIGPKDQAEGMLAMQMAVIHQAIMKVMRDFNSAAYQPHFIAADKSLNSLARTFAMQMDTLKRYRTGGQQKVTVEHVTVNEGGQAIVGNVGSSEKSPAAEKQTAPQKQSVARLTDQSETLMKMPPIEEKEKVPVKKG